MTFPAFSVGTPHSSGTGSTSRVVSFGATLAAGDGVILLLDYRDGTITFPGGAWAQPLGAPTVQNNFSFNCFVLVASGGETQVTLTTQSAVVMIVYPIRVPAATWNSAQAVEVTTATATNDPPSETASWGVADNGWIANVSSNSGTTYTGFPTGFGNDQVALNSTFDSLNTAMATSDNATATLDPTVFTPGGGARSITATVVVRGAAVADVSATLSAPLGGSGVITSTVEHIATAGAALGGSASMTATVEHPATVNAALGGVATLTATVDHPAVFSGALGFIADVTATVEGDVQATLAAALGGVASATALVEHTAVFGAGLGGVAAAAALVDHTALLNAALGGTAAITAAVAHVATMSGALGFTASSSAVVAHPVTMSGALGGVASLTAQVTGPEVLATFNTTLGFQGSLSATAEHLITLTSGLGGTGAVSAGVEHQVTLVSALGFNGEATAVVSWDTPDMEFTVYGSLCEPWPFIWCGDISGVNPEVTGHAIMAASEILWEATGRRFGNCVVTVRPCRQDCAQFPSDVRVYDHGVISSSTWGWPFPTLINGSMVNLACGMCIGSCGCTTASEVILPESVYQVDSVVIDGASLPASGWALYDGNLLVKAEGEWPLCQEWRRTAGGPGVWTVTARFGAPVPTIGQQAVGILGLEIAKMCCGMACGLPPSVTRVTRQGVTMEKISTADFLKGGLTGLTIPDRFIQAMNPNRIMDRARVYSPDVLNARTQ